MVAFLRERGFAAGYSLMVVGAALLLAGFGLDAWLHARDPGLVEEEGIFTLSNPGHLLVAVGLALTLLGAGTGPYGRWVLGRGSPALSVAVPGLAVGVAVAVSLAFAAAINSLSHEDDHVKSAGATQQAHDVSPGAFTAGVEAEDSAAEHPGHLANVLPENQAFLNLEETTFHEPPNPAPVTAENIRFAEQFLVDARAATEKYRDVSVALADGYFQITQDLPLIGAHFFKPVNVGSLDPARPGILLYEEDGAGGWSLVGLAYMLPKAAGVDTPPETPFGGLVKWHYHTNLCFTPGQVSIAASADECAGFYVAETPWLLHVWVWKDSPEGIFDHMNSLLQ